MAEKQELSYPLHECVFVGDVQEFSRTMRTEDLSRKDKHGKYTIGSGRSIDGSFCYFQFFVIGNTALHLAIMLGRKGKLHTVIKYRLY